MNPFRKRIKNSSTNDDAPLSKGVKGFTLVETLVAVLILTLTIVGPFQIAQGVLASAYTARDQLIAAGLAQEAIEYVRQLRDTNYLYNTNHGPTYTWLYGVDGTSGSPDCYDTSGHACVVDPSQSPVIASSIIACADTTCAAKPLLMSGTNLYNQNSGTATMFVRKVQLHFISPTETNVTVTVTWTSHGVHTVTLNEDLQDWL